MSSRASASSLRKFLAARFARGQYLGLHLTIGLAISLAALWLFAALADGVLGNESITRFDATLLGWLRRHATPVGYHAFEIVTRLGSPIAMLIVALVVGFELARERRWFLLGGWVAAFVGGWLLDTALKSLIRRPRPLDADLFLAGISWSFPSGHTMGSLIGCGMLSYLLVVYRVRSRGARVAIVTLAGLFVLAVGMSRLYLGVHYLSDVLAGLAAGTLWLAACISGLEVARRLPRPGAA